MRPSTIPAGEYVPTADQRVVIYCVPWAHFDAQIRLRGEAPVPRFAYVNGALELMTPSKDHERIKSYIGCLIEAYALEAGLDLSPYGGWTLRSTAREAGAEPDECYIIGPEQDRETPDLAIEVIWTAGGINKLEIYRRLEIREVWFWRAGTIEVHCLEDGQYLRKAQSSMLPGLDVALLTTFLEKPTALQAVRAFRESLRGSPQPPRALDRKG